MKPPPLLRSVATVMTSDMFREASRPFDSRMVTDRPEMLSLDRAVAIEGERGHRQGSEEVRVPRGRITQVERLAVDITTFAHVPTPAIAPVRLDRYACRDLAVHFHCAAAISTRAL